jgi:hypothetical protein
MSGNLGTAARTGPCDHAAHFHLTFQGSPYYDLFVRNIQSNQILVIPWPNGSDTDFESKAGCSQSNRVPAFKQTTLHIHLLQNYTRDNANYWFSGHYLVFVYSCYNLFQITDLSG